jgi:hypothetical protein
MKTKKASISLFIKVIILLFGKGWLFFTEQPAALLTIKIQQFFHAMMKHILL